MHPKIERAKLPGVVEGWEVQTPRSSTRSTYGSPKAFVLEDKDHLLAPVAARPSNPALCPLHSDGVTPHGDRDDAMRKQQKQWRVVVWPGAPSSVFDMDVAPLVGRKVIFRSQGPCHPLPPDVHTCASLTS